MLSHEKLAWVFANFTDEELLAYNENRTYGACQNRPRLKEIAQFCVDTWSGDLVEIGALHGGTTVILAEIARTVGRRVIVVDPFDVGISAYADYYNMFLKNTEPWRDTIDLIKLSSMDAKAIAIVGGRGLCFAYIDGLHTYAACFSDIKTVGHCNGIIAVDDIHTEHKFSSAILRAYLDGAALLNRIPIDNLLVREGYLVKV